MLVTKCWGSYVVIVDEDAAHLLEDNYFRVAEKLGKPTGVLVRIDSIEYYLHRLILKPTVTELCDHINGNVLDNRKVNLRLVTYQQNAFNRPSPKTKKSGLPKGVSFCKKLQKYKSGIKWLGTQIHLGYFDSIQEAEDAYLRAAEFYFGIHSHHISQQNSI